LADLSYKSLPYLDKSVSELIEIENIQKVKFPFENEYMNAKEYNQRIESKKIAFKKDWESKGFLSWNLPEYIAYSKLFKQ
jgi:hypothetical protein